MDFTEKYRPTKLKDCILPKRIKSKLEKLVSKKNIGHLIFSGTAGIGKTATAMAKPRGYIINIPPQNDFQRVISPFQNLLRIFIIKIYYKIVN